MDELIELIRGTLKIPPVEVIGPITPSCFTIQKVLTQNEIIGDGDDKLDSDLTQVDIWTRNKTTTYALAKKLKKALISSVDTIPTIDYLVDVNAKLWRAELKFYVINKEE